MLEQDKGIKAIFDEWVNNVVWSLASEIFGVTVGSAPRVVLLSGCPPSFHFRKLYHIPFRLRELFLPSKMKMTSDIRHINCFGSDQIPTGVFLLRRYGKY